MQHMIQGAEPHEDANSVHMRLSDDRQQRENVVTVEDPEDRKLGDRHYQDTINSGVQVQVLLFGDCAFPWHRLCGVLIIMGYFSTRLNTW